MNQWEYIRAKARLREQNQQLLDERDGLVCLPHTVMRKLAEFLTGRYNRIVVCTVMMYFYAPDAISGYKMSNNVRDRLAKAMRCNPGYITRKRDVVLFLYDHDKKFHKEVDDAIDKSIDFVNNIL